MGLTLYCIASQNGQAHFKNLAAIASGSSLKLRIKGLRKSQIKTLDL